MSVERLGEENDVERKIFIDTGLETLNSLRQGQLQDGDGKRNTSITETPCAELLEVYVKRRIRSLWMYVWKD